MNEVRPYDKLVSTMAIRPDDQGQRYREYGTLVSDICPLCRYTKLGLSAKSCNRYMILSGRNPVGGDSISLRPYYTVRFNSLMTEFLLNSSALA